MVRRLPVGPALRDRLGGPTVVRKLASSPRSRVWLVEFDGSPAIVKQIAGGADAAARYRREIAALTLAAGVRPAVVPELLGTDPDEAVMVLEYVPAGGPTRAGWHVDYSVALARLHTSLIGASGPTKPAPGRTAAAEQPRASTVDGARIDALPAHCGPGRADVRAFLEFAARLGVAVPGGAEAELHALLVRLAAAGRDALLHGDPCPDNAMPTAGGIRFVDLEQAALGSGAIELAYLSMGFPTCWCVAATPAAVLAEARAAYFETWRAMAGAEPRGDLTDACAGWVIAGDGLVERARRGAADHLARAARRDWRWGTGTARERLLHRLGVVAAKARDRHDLANIARLCADLYALMLRRWPRLRPLAVATGDPLPDR